MKPSCDSNEKCIIHNKLVCFHDVANYSGLSNRSVSCKTCKYIVNQTEIWFTCGQEGWESKSKGVNMKISDLNIAVLNRPSSE